MNVGLVSNIHLISVDFKVKEVQMVYEEAE